jgi:hypothetical protein
MGYCVNSSGALVPFASDKAACDAVGGSFTAEINPTTRPADPKGFGFGAFKTPDGTAASFKNLLSPDAWIKESQDIADWGAEPGGLWPIGKAIDIINPIPEVMGLIKNMSDPELRDATIKFVTENPIKAASVGAVSIFIKKAQKVKAAAKLGYVGHVGLEALESDLPVMESAKKEIERGILNIHGGEPAVENKEDEDENPPLTDEEQEKLDEQAADDLAKNRTSTETARKSFSERFKAGMKDPATLNKLGMLMDYYGRNLQDRGENPLIAYEAAKADQMAANKPNTAAFNAVNMTNDALYDIFTPKKGWFKNRSEADRDKAAGTMVGRYRTIQNAALTRHGVILTHAEIMKLLEKERDARLANK